MWCIKINLQIAINKIMTYSNFKLCIFINSMLNVQTSISLNSFSEGQQIMKDMMPRRKISRNNLRRNNCDTLMVPKKELKFLLKHTRFDKEEIIQFYRSDQNKFNLVATLSIIMMQRWNIFFRNFSYDCPNGKLAQSKVQKMYEMVLPTAASAKVFVEQIFRIFDEDRNGFISFTVSDNQTWS